MQRKRVSSDSAYRASATAGENQMLAREPPRGVAEQHEEHRDGGPPQRGDPPVGPELPSVVELDEPPTQWPVPRPGAPLVEQRHRARRSGPHLRGQELLAHQLPSALFTRCAPRVAGSGRPMSSATPSPAGPGRRVRDYAGRPVARTTRHDKTPYSNLEPGSKLKGIPLYLANREVDRCLNATAVRSLPSTAGRH